MGNVCGDAMRFGTLGGGRDWSLWSP